MNARHLLPIVYKPQRHKKPGYLPLALSSTPSCSFKKSAT